MVRPQRGQEVSPRASKSFGSSGIGKSRFRFQGSRHGKGVLSLSVDDECRSSDPLVVLVHPAHNLMSSGIALISTANVTFCNPVLVLSIKLPRLSGRDHADFSSQLLLECHCSYKQPNTSFMRHATPSFLLAMSDSSGSPRHTYYCAATQTPSARRVVFRKL